MEQTTYLIDSKTMLRSLLVLTVVFALGVFPGCGGGGGGGGGGSVAPTVPTTGNVGGYIDSDPVARIATRETFLTGVAGATVGLYGNGASESTTSNTSGYYAFSDIAPGSYYLISAVSGSTTLQGYTNISAGQTTSKNINARTTATVMAIYQSYQQGITRPTDPTTAETSALISTIETEIETGLAAGTYDYNTVMNGTNVSNVVTRLQAGGSLSDQTAPTVSFTYPGENQQVSDYMFMHESFYLQFTFSDTTPIYTSSLQATISMDGATAQDISSYFSVSSSTITSTNLNQFTRNMFVFTSNDTTRTMTVTVTVEDMSGNSSSTSFNFIVYPVGDLPGQ